MAGVGGCFMQGVCSFLKEKACEQRCASFAKALDANQSIKQSINNSESWCKKHRQVSCLGVEEQTKG